MRTAPTLLFATLVLANPAPITNPEASQIQKADVPVLARDFSAHEVRKVSSAAGAAAGAAGRAGGAAANKANNTLDNAAGAFLPNRALEWGVLGLGVVEIVRLWG
ncbi:unnamed protein product [Periconia digitata]|uniref:Uncharacterized protein n=1 Tax=Periconia digitata TaxID=1303443 RepID=A0A9W4UJH2_9PLEO|nr:unnamed protein product [Periconia digitata]